MGTTADASLAAPSTASDNITTLVSIIGALILTAIIDHATSPLVTATITGTAPISITPAANITIHLIVIAVFVVVDGDVAITGCC